MTAVVVIIGFLVYAGPCALFYLLGKQQGYQQGLAAAVIRQEDRGPKQYGWTPRT